MYDDKHALAVANPVSLEIRWPAPVTCCQHCHNCDVAEVLKRTTLPQDTASGTKVQRAMQLRSLQFAFPDTGQTDLAPCEWRCWIALQDSVGLSVKPKGKNTTMLN